MRIRVRERQREALLDGEPPTIPGSILFCPPAPQPIGFFSYVVSAWLHFLFVTLSLMILELFPPVESPAVLYRSKALVIRLPKPERIARPMAEGEAERAEDRAETLRKMADQLVVAMREGKEQLEPEPTADAGPEGGAEAAPAKVETVLIQPQFPLDMQPPPLSPMVPSVLLWPKQMPAAPPENVVVSARGPGPQEITVPDEPQPVPAVRPSVRKFVAPDAFRPNLPVSRAELSAPPAIEQGPTIALLSISNAPMVRDTIVVPPGNIIPAPAKPAGAEANGSSGNVATAESFGGKGTAKPAGAGTPPASAPAPVRASAADGSPSRTAPSRTSPNRTVPDTSGGTRTTPAKVAATKAPSPPRAAAVSAAPQGEKAEKVGLPSASAIAGTVGPLIDRKQPVAPSVKGAASTSTEPVVNAVTTGRVEHPANGNFDVVIVQNTLDESATGGGKLLHGRPIYTVYLQVGDTKDWILHYCVKDAGVVQRGAVFQLPDPRPVKAPYPRVTYRPSETVVGSDAYVLVHGLIDSAGMLQNLKVVGPIQSGEAALLAALGRWRFRPATRAEEPEPVEMVLAIPIRKS